MDASPRFRVLGPLEVLDPAGAPVAIGGLKRRALLARLLVDADRVVPFDRLAHDLWDGNPGPGTPATLQSHVSQLRRVVGADRLRTVGAGYVLDVGDEDLDARLADAELAIGRRLLASGDVAAAAETLQSALARWRGSAFGELHDAPWAVAEAGRLDELRVQTVETLLGARLALGAHAEVVISSELAIAEQPLRERLWALLIEALYRDGRQADALRAYQRLRTTLADELGIDPSPDLQALERQVLVQSDALAAPGSSSKPATPAAMPGDDVPALPTGVVTFLLTDVVGSTRLWEAAPGDMPVALARHDRVVADAVSAHDGVLLKARGEGDSTFSVFRRPSDAVSAAVTLRDGLEKQSWPAGCEIVVRTAVHAGEALERDGDYFGRTVNRVARLRATAEPGQILLSRAVAEVVRDELPVEVTLVDLGPRELRDLDRPEVVFAVEPAGTTDTVARSDPPDAAVHSTRRRTTVTALYVHFDDSEMLPGRDDPEATGALQRRYHAIIESEIAGAGGQIVRVTPDGVLAAFGLPGIREDDTERALRAAAVVSAACSRVRNDTVAGHGAALSVAVGLEAGEVVIDHDELTGDAVRVAARIAAAARPGEILVGEQAWRITRHVAELSRADVEPVRGRGAPTPAHRLVGWNTPGETPSEFVGREAELGALVSLFDEVVTARSPRRATVIGSPGVGKSRLVRELRIALQGRATVVGAGCDSAGGATFAPVAELLEGIGSLDSLLTDEHERDRVRSVVASLATGGAPATPEETFWAVRRLIESASRRQPVVAVLDDIHWAEPLLLDLVEHLGEWITEHPVMVVAVARPELRELRPSLTDPGGRTLVVVALEGLDPRATEHLARDLLGTSEPPAELLARLAPTTDGNPLFVRELVRMLVDDGVLVRDRHDGGDRWRLTVDAADIDVPPTIQTLLAARVDRLDVDERVVLERAAVLGTEVYRGALVDLLPPSLRDRIDPLLEALRRKELLEPAGSYWIDERVLRFHHVLIREAAYRRLLREQRADLHERSAAWLVTKTGGGVEHDEAIGYHLEQAQANRRALGPLDAVGRDVAGEAAVRLASAARRALDRDDLPAAASLAQRALTCLEPDDERRGELLLTAAEALLGLGDVGAADGVLAILSDAAGGDPRLSAWSTCFAVQRRALADARAIGDSEERVIDAAQLLAALGDPAGAAKAHRVHASVLARLGRVGECEAALDRALGAARAADDRHQMTSALTAAPLATVWGPSPVPRAGGRCLDVIRLARITTGARSVEATSVRCQAMLEALRGRADAARKLLAIARAAASELGLRHELLAAEQFAGVIELWSGNPAVADVHLERAHEGFRSMGVAADAAQTAALRGRVALARGDHDAALAFAEASERLGGEDLKTAIAWRTVRAEVLAARGAFADAVGLAAAAVALAERTDALIDHADACAAMAAVHASVGDGAAASEMAERAASLYERKGATAPLTRLAPYRHEMAGAAGGDRTDRALAAGNGATTEPENAATRHFRRLGALLESRRAGDIRSICSTDAVTDDRRAGVRNRFVGIDAVAADFVAASRVGAMDIVIEQLATRGDRLALLRTRWTGRRFEVEHLTIIGLDAEGKGRLCVNFDLHDAAAAIAELDRLSASGAYGPVGLDLTGTSAGRFHRALTDTILDRDWNAAASLMRDDFALDDRRTGLGNRVGSRSDTIAWLREAADAGFEQIAGDGLAERGDRLMLVRWTVEADGFEIGGLSLAEVDSDGLGSSLCLFDLDDLATALAELDERHRAITAGRVHADIENQASRNWAAFPPLLLGGNVDACRALLADGCVAEDRRPGLANRIEGRGAVFGQLHSLLQIGVRTVECDTLAVRGDLLALVRTRFAGPSFETTAFFVVGVDFDGRSVRSVCFDQAQLTDALIELDASFRADEGAFDGRGRATAVDAFPRSGFDAALARFDKRSAGDDRPSSSAASWAVYGAWLRAINNRDAASMRSWLADDFVLEDHRPAGWGRLDAGGMVQHLLELDDLVAGRWTTVREVHAVGDGGLVLSTLTTGTTPDGGKIELAVLAVTMVADGRVTRIEPFPPDAVAAALARFTVLDSDRRSVSAGLPSRGL